MSKILYEVYKNDVKDSESALFGRYYARVKSYETYDTTKMAQHISEHGSVFTDDVVQGLMLKFKNCLIEQLLNSRKVKINGLGTFYLTIECEKGGAESEEKFNVAQHLKGLHIRFLPDLETEARLSSREFIKRAEFYNVKNLLKDGSEAVGETVNGDSTANDGSTANGGSQTGDGSTTGNGDSTGNTTGGDSGSGGDTGDTGDTPGED